MLTRSLTERVQSEFFLIKLYPSLMKDGPMLQSEF